MGDREKLAQVLTALLANAIRYTDGGGNIRVEFHRGKQGEATIKVMDSGAGIPRELADKLFDAAASGGRRCRVRLIGTSLVLLAFGGVFGTWTYFSGLVLETGARAEACMADEIAAQAVDLSGEWAFEVTTSQGRDRRTYRGGIRT